MQGVGGAGEVEGLEAWVVGGDDRSSMPSLLGSPEPGEMVHPRTDGASW